jgi:hypothetical protein
MNAMIPPMHSTPRVEGGNVGWVNARRIRGHALLLGVCLWSLYVWNLSTPGLLDRSGNLKGTDFLHFYTMGSLAAANRGADLYDIDAASAWISRHVPQAVGRRYLPLYPPQVSLLFVPFVYLPYQKALGLWWCCSALLYAVSCYAIWRTCPKLKTQRLTIVLAAIAFPAFFNLIAWGQTSALALVCFTAAFLLLNKQQDVLAGCALGCLIFKPQLGVATAVVFLAIGAWKIVGGAIVSACAQLLAGVLYFGWAPLLRWFSVLRNVRFEWRWLEPRPYQTHSLRTFWALLLPWSSAATAVWVLSAGLILALTISLWKRRESVPLSLRYSALLFATVLVAPHLTVYDLVILAPAFLLTADWAAGQPAHPSIRSLSILYYLVFLLPLLSPVVRWVHLQGSVIAMAACVYALWRLSRAASPEVCPAN